MGRSRDAVQRLAAPRGVPWHSPRSRRRARSSARAWAACSARRARRRLHQLAAARSCAGVRRFFAAESLQRLAGALGRRDRLAVAGMGGSRVAHEGARWRAPRVRRRESLLGGRTGGLHRSGPARRGPRASAALPVFGVDGIPASGQSSEVLKHHGLDVETPLRTRSARHRGLGACR